MIDAVSMSHPFDASRGVFPDMPSATAKTSGRHGPTSIAAYDLPTRDKLAVLRALLPVDRREGFALDIGSGTGYTTQQVFGHSPTVCLDLHEPNLRYHRSKLEGRSSTDQVLFVVAHAAALPFEAAAFDRILCSEVLEHLEDDQAAIEELARVLTHTGRAILTVPYAGFGFTSFLELFGTKTVHDFPGPERHVRRGYDERSLQQLLACCGLEIERQAYYLRFFTRLATDLASLAHLLYQRLVHRRRAWSWSEVGALEAAPAFRLYATLVFPLLWAVSRLDRCLASCRGFGLIAIIRKRPGREEPHDWRAS